MEKNKFKYILDEEISPMVPEELLDEYNDIMNNELRTVLRANSIRRYLEGIIELFIKNNILNNMRISQNDWDKKDLFNKIKIIGQYYDCEIKNKFHQIRIVGNKGSHFGSNVGEEEINKSILIINNIFEYLIIEYFKRHTFGTEAPVLTLLSALPPRSRVKIIEEVRKDDEFNEWTIDKLSMAYLKNGDIVKSKEFLKECLDKNYIDEEQYMEYIWKINILYDNIDKFDISKNILDTKRIANLLIKSSESYKNYQEFLELFLILLSGYNYQKA